MWKKKFRSMKYPEFPKMRFSRKLLCFAIGGRKRKEVKYEKKREGNGSSELGPPCLCIIAHDLDNWLFEPMTQ